MESRNPSVQSESSAVTAAAAAASIHTESADPPICADIHSESVATGIDRIANDSKADPEQQQFQTLVNRRTVYETAPKTVEAPAQTKHMLRLVPLQDHAHAVPSTIAKIVVRRLSQDGVIQIGRIENPDDKCHAIVYLSKVVSRRHAEAVLEHGQWYLRDIGSSSGTFVNNVRLSHAGQVSELRRLVSGDILKFGVDFRGGSEPLYRSIRVRVEIDGKFVHEPDEYQVGQMRLFKQLAASHGAEVDEVCAICLEPMLPASSLFKAGCCHMWHYRCIRPALIPNYPYFDCPLCRKTCDMEEADDDELDVVDEADDDSEAASA